VLSSITTPSSTAGGSCRCGQLRVVCPRSLEDSARLEHLDVPSARYAKVVLTTAVGHVFAIHTDTGEWPCWRLGLQFAVFSQP